MAASNVLRRLQVAPLLTLLGSPGVGAAQDRIEFQQVMELMPPVDAPAILGGSHLSRGPNGRLFVSPTHEPGVALVFSETGEYLRSFGRAGEGPGEYSTRGVTGITARRDGTLLVLDTYNRRVTELDEEFGLVRTIPLRMLAWGVEDTRQGVIVQGWLDGGGALPLHFIDDEGGVRESLGLGQPGVSHEPWRFTLADDRHVVVVPRRSLSLQLVDLENGTATRHDVDVPGLDLVHEYDAVLDVVANGKGQLRMVIQTFKDRATPRDEERPRANSLIDDFDLALVEVEAASGKVLSHSSLDQPAWAFLDFNHMYGHTEAPSGELVVTVWEVAISRD